MSSSTVGEEPTDAWLVEASRRLDAPSGDVARLIARVAGAVPALRRPGRELATDDVRIRINDRVVKQLLATRVRTATGRLVVRAQVDGDADQVTGVMIGLIARYGDDLHAEAERVRAAVRETLTLALGSDIAASVGDRIHVRWQDVYTRQWLD
ncbi:hypothetical protein [Gordonia neofelifaecis]|uniref:Uncharacterized protein n=1 Tax=Gordonia neofelifaecis NRRL B-59395 TaxID=644548 RepID=F1YK91_9ACTN|nr:hypothetical protein [Gordonia neofelifaecis]EGD54937.1 hypothetical protein SCNU_12040 [Gordonia neofelifaecis NRRL B-59395]